MVGWFLPFLLDAGRLAPVLQKRVLSQQTQRGSGSLAYITHRSLSLFTPCHGYGQCSLCYYYAVAAAAAVYVSSELM